MLGYLRGWGSPVAGRVQSLHYELLAEADELPAGVYVFAEPHRLTEAERAIALEVADQLRAADPAVKILNDPSLPLHPFDSLQRLAAGGDAVRAYRPASPPPSPRFPVLIRDEWWLAEQDEPAQTEHELGAVLFEAVHEGGSQEELIVVEAPSGQDIPPYTGGSVLRIGDATILGPRVASPEWPPRVCHGEQDRMWIDWGRRAADATGLEYGRLDFVIDGDRALVWSVDANPSLLPAPEWVPPEQVAVVRAIADRVNAALERMGGQEDDGDWVPVQVRPELLEALDAEFDAGRPR